MGKYKWKGGWITTWSCIQLRIVSEEALHSIQIMPILVEFDSEPKSSGNEKAIDGLANAKAPGNDVIPKEVMKQGIQDLLPHLNELLLL